MPSIFSFDASTITSAGTLERASFTKGSHPGLDYPNDYSAVAPDQSIATSGGVDVFSMTIRPNPNRPVAKSWAKVIDSARARWPELTVVEPV